MREVQSNRALVRRLNKLPLCKFVLKEAGSVRGEPDIIGCVDGRAVVAEMKNTKPTASSQGHALQRKRLEEWALAGALTHLVVGADELKSFEDWISQLSKDRMDVARAAMDEKKLRRTEEEEAKALKLTVLPED